jgi:hypothetical protein
MTAYALKYTNEALAFITLYRTMRPEVKEEVRDMIIKETADNETDLLTSLSFQAWDEDTAAAIEESNVWEKFYNNHKHV